ncbi:MAG: Mrp/NBP35 family ATP-binding protein [Dehalococcoidia bacterium]|nr:Mrp/NBP35 family ATP-binding protein [Dehalococcoidia bacterium]
MARQMSPQEQARLESIKRSWQQKREIGNKLARITNKIGVYSGKGGVGKTTVAVNLAVTLAQMGYSVGLMDTDIDCPNANKVLGIDEKPTAQDGIIIPPEKYGVKIISMAFFQENEEEAIIWRGPMVHNAINQFLQTTDWGDLDYIIVDLPPGTSDAPLTVMQVLSLDGFVIVTSPQDLAKLDAKRSINMVRKLNVSVLGVVENFSGEMFGSGAGEELAEEMGLSFMGRIDLRPEYRDTSKPAVLSSPVIAAEYESIALALEPALAAADTSS